MDFEIDDDRHDYHEDLCARVFNNELILAKVFGHLSLRQLFQCCLVCHKWHSEATRVATNRSQSLNICHLFHADHPSQDTDLSLIRDPTAGDGDMADDSMDYCSRVHWVERYDFKANVIRSMTADLQSVPAVCLLVYGSLGEDVKLTQRLYHTEILRRYLPRSDCLVVNLNSQCLIGAPTTSSVPIHKITHFGDLAAVSLLLLPKYKPGVDVTVFSGADMRQKVFTRPDIKALVVFTTSSIFQDNRNLYQDIDSMSRFINTRAEGRVAFGGYNSAYFSFNKQDFLNYLVPSDDSCGGGDGDGPMGAASDSGPPLDPSQLEARELIGLCFSGPHVRAGSVLLNTKRVNKTEHKLREFKKDLGFEAVTDRTHETIVFMFTDEEKNDAFLKLELFRKVFGAASQVFGVSGYGQYGYNYWPNIGAGVPNGSKKSGHKNGRRFGNINNNGLRVRPKSRPRIILNTNMTTFVVINLQKRFI